VENIIPNESGIIIEPRHVQSALRNLAGIAEHENAQRFMLESSDLDLNKIFA